MSFEFPYEFQAQSASFCKEVSWNFDRDFMDSLDKFEKGSCLDTVRSSDP
jgi:hypothetical protein